MSNGCRRACLKEHQRQAKERRLREVEQRRLERALQYEPLVEEESNEEFDEFEFDLSEVVVNEGGYLEVVHVDLVVDVENIKCLAPTGIGSSRNWTPTTERMLVRRPLPSP